MARVLYDRSMTTSPARPTFPPIVALYAGNDASPVCADIIRRTFPDTTVLQLEGTGADYLPNSYTPWYLMRPAGRCRTCNRQWRGEAELADGQCQDCAAGVSSEAVAELAELGQ